jgi:hypothetical protein
MAASKDTVADMTVHGGAAFRSLDAPPASVNHTAGFRLDATASPAAVPPEAAPGFALYIPVIFRTEGLGLRKVGLWSVPTPKLLGEHSEQDVVIFPLSSEFVLFCCDFAGLCLMLSRPVLYLLSPSIFPKLLIIPRSLAESRTFY